MPARGLLLPLAVADPKMLVAVQALDGVSAAALGVLLPLVAADLTRGTNRFNLCMGVFGLATGVGATVSTAAAGAVAGWLGTGVAFVALAGAGLFAVLLVLFAMPETRLPPAGAGAGAREQAEVPGGGGPSKAADWPPRHPVRREWPRHPGTERPVARLLDPVLGGRAALERRRGWPAPGRTQRPRRGRAGWRPKRSAKPPLSGLGGGDSPPFGKGRISRVVTRPITGRRHARAGGRGRTASRS